MYGRFEGNFDECGGIAPAAIHSYNKVDLNLCFFFKVSKSCRESK